MTETYDLHTPDGLRRRDEEVATRRIPARYQAATVTDPEIAGWCAGLAETVGDPVQSLLITGPTGVGKTWEAFGAIRQLAAAGIVRGWRATTSADLYAALRPRAGVDSEHEFRRFADCPLLLLDDLAAAKPSEWTEEVDYRIVNHRSAAMLPTIFTTNLPLRDPAGSHDVESLESSLSDRVFSRLAECKVVRLKGRDRRRPA